MYVALGDLELRDAWLASDVAARWRVKLAVSQASGAQACSLVYFELDHGCRLPRHTDSVEEVLVLLEGAAISRIEDRELELAAPCAVTIPAMAVHELRNAGSCVLRAVGFFATPSPVSVFEEPVMPAGSRERGVDR